MHRSLQFAVSLGSLYVLLSGCGSSTASDPFAVGSSATATAGGTAGSASTGTIIATSGGVTAGGTAGTGAATAAGTAGTAGNGEGGLCGTTNVGSMGGEANMLLVVDRSGSMGETPTGYMQTKWAALVAALPAALATVPPGLSLGLEFFSSPAGRGGGGGGTCSVTMGAGGVQVPVAAAATSVPAITTALQGAMPGGSTPTALGLQGALTYFTTGAGAALTGSKYVLLATDGAPNCNSMITCAATAPACTGTANNGMCPANSCLDDVATIAAVTALANAGIKTYVVGIPGTEDYATVLDAMARAGGVPTTNADGHVYYEVAASGGAAGLQAVLAGIVSTVKITSCNLQLAQAAAAGFTVAVYVDGMLTTFQTDWTLDTTTNPPTVVLQGAVCQNVTTNGANSVQIQIFCPGAVPPPRIN